MKFNQFNKIPRLSREITITEKIDGTNASVYICNQSTFLDNFDLNVSDSEKQKFWEEYCLGLDGGNMLIFAGSKNRWINTKKDNYGFANWVQQNSEELFKLGEGQHFGEWMGNGIQRKYGLKEKRFILFNVGKWVKLQEDEKLDIEDKRKKCPSCCEVVPILAECMFDTEKIEGVVKHLKENGSVLVPGFMNPEGIVIYHKASRQLFKKTIENDDKPKGTVK